MPPLTIEPMAVPLRQDASGAIRVGGTRVLLDLVIRAHLRGDSPEEIARSYDTLALPDLYAVLAYYLSHRREVDDYLARREEEAEALRREIEASQTARPDKDRLLRRSPFGLIGVHARNRRQA